MQSPKACIAVGHSRPEGRDFAPAGKVQETQDTVKSEISKGKPCMPDSHGIDLLQTENPA